MFNRKKKDLTTVNDIFKTDDIKDALKLLAEESPYIDDLVIIYTDKRDGKPYTITLDSLEIRTAVWMFESVKLALLNQTEEAN
jgi:hypothetical protein